MELENPEPQDDFSLAFEAAALGEEPKVEEPKVEEPKVEEPKVEEPKVEEPKVEEPKVEEPKVEEPKVEEPKVEEPKVEEPKVEEPKVEEPKVEEPKVDPELQRLQAEALAREQYTDEEAASIKTMVEEFPEVAAAVKAELRVLHAKLENAYNATIQTVLSQIYQQVAPALTEAQNAARSRFEATVFAVHPDAKTILPEVDKWVATKPAFLQTAYNAILDSGTAEDTVTLLNLFKQETKPVAAPPKEGGGEKTVEVDPEKERKLASQEGIRGRQTQKTGGIDEDDFESAFNSAATAK